MTNSKTNKKVIKVLHESKDCRIVIVERDKDDDKTPLAPTTKPVVTPKATVKVSRPKDNRNMSESLFCVKPVTVEKGKTKWAVFAKDFGGEVIAARVYDKKVEAETGLAELQHRLATCNGRVAEALKEWQGEYLDLPMYLRMKMEKAAQYCGTYTDADDDDLLGIFWDDETATPVA